VVAALAATVGPLALAASALAVDSFVPTLHLVDPAPTEDGAFGSAIIDSFLDVEQPPFTFIGAPNHDTSVPHAGEVFVYFRGALVQSMSASDGRSGDEFGAAIGVDGLSVGILIGAPSADNGGAVYHFTLVGTTVNQQWKSSDPTDTPGDQYGAAVAALGDTSFVVGAPRGGRDEPGAVYIVDQSGAVVKMLMSPNPKPGDLFGTSVAVGDGIIFVGAPFADVGASDAGAVYAFNGFEGTPEFGQLVRTFHKATPTPFDAFGSALSAHVARLFVGAPLDDTACTDCGAVYEFDEVSEVPVATTVSPLPQAGSRFGFSIAAIDSLAVGAPLEDVAGTVDAGAVYLFDSLGQHRLLRRGAANFDRFGRTVGGINAELVVGAPFATAAVSGAGTADAFADTCGDCQHEDGEGCDDGNRNDGDGCDANCRVEKGFSCFDGAGCSQCFSCSGFAAVDTGVATPGDLVTCNCGDTQGLACQESSCAVGTCDGSVCTGGTPDDAMCDDGDPCTTDVCDAAAGCIHNLNPCDDTNPCTADRCEAGQCVHDPLDCACQSDDDCNDHEECNGIERCSECVFCDVKHACCDTPKFCATNDTSIPPTGAPCDDRDQCTIDDVCTTDRRCTGTERSSSEYEAITCLETPTCTEGSTPRKIVRQFERAQSNATTAEAATTVGKQTSQLKRCLRHLAKARRLVQRAGRRHHLAQDCMDFWLATLARAEMAAKGVLASIATGP
jgi:cysteine-rich repeat protein